MSQAKINQDERIVKRSKKGRFDFFSKQDENQLFDKNGLKFMRDKVDDAFRLLKGNDFKIYLFIMRETFGYHCHKAALSLRYISEHTGIPNSEVSKSISRLKNYSIPFITDHGSYGKDSEYARVFSINTEYEYDINEQKIVAIDKEELSSKIDGNAKQNDGKIPELNSKIPESIPKIPELISENNVTTCENLKSGVEKNSSHTIYKERRVLNKNIVVVKKQKNCFSVSDPSINSFLDSDLFFKGNHFFIPKSFLENLKQEIPGLEKLEDNLISEIFHQIEDWLIENDGPKEFSEEFFISWFRRNREIQKHLRRALKPPRKKREKIIITPLADLIYQSFKDAYQEYHNLEFDKWLSPKKIYSERRACQQLLTAFQNENRYQSIDDEEIINSFSDLWDKFYHAFSDEDYFFEHFSPKMFIEKANVILRQIIEYSDLNMVTEQTEEFLSNQNIFF